MSSSKPEHNIVASKISVEVVIESTTKQQISIAKHLQHLFPSQPTKPTHQLLIQKSGIEVKLVDNKNTHKVDFSTIDRRVGGGNLSRRQIFPKAIGSTGHRVVDATAGFGGDAARLALMGYQVTAIEQSPIIAAMLQDAVARSKKDNHLSLALGDRLEVVEANAIEWLLEHSGSDVVYLDPMFPPKKKKSALPPGHIQLLQSIVGDFDHEANLELFQTAIQSAAHRVVVKRPNHAPPMGENPTMVHQGKLVRYEVYKPK